MKPVHVEPAAVEELDCPVDDPGQFYTGLVADLYEPLVGNPSQPNDYVRFLDAAGTPALELACGAGTPMLELIQRGYEIEGVDSSSDMLARCRRKADDLGIVDRDHDCSGSIVDPIIDHLGDIVAPRERVRCERNDLWDIVMSSFPKVHPPRLPSG